MANANFITQFEYKLNNLTGSETQAELLALRATADKYPELDEIAVGLLDAAIDVYADALTNTSTVKELSTVGNADAASTANAGGGGSVVGDVKAMHVTDVGGLYINGDEEWLRTGIIEDNVAAYPDAAVRERGIDYLNKTLDYNVLGTGNFRSIASNGTNLVIVNSFTGYLVTELDVGTLLPTGFSFTVQEQGTSPFGVDFYDDSYWVVQRSGNAVYKYTSGGVYTGTSFALTEGPTAWHKFIAHDDTHFYISNDDANFYQYTLAGVSTGFSIPFDNLVAGLVSIRGFDIVGGNLVIAWVSASDGMLISEMTTSGVLLKSYPINTPYLNDIASIEDKSIWVQSGNTKAVSNYSLDFPYVGEVTTQLQNDFPVYVRIK